LFELPLLNTIILLSSGATVTYAHHSLIKGDRKGSLYGSIATVILAFIFTGLNYINILFFYFDYTKRSSSNNDNLAHHESKGVLKFKKLYSTRVDVKESKLSPYWVTGFADAEATFSLKIYKNSATRSGISLFSVGSFRHKRFYSVNLQPAIDPNWVTGLSDGEGCFSMSVAKKSTSRVGWGVTPCFIINLHIKDIIMLRKLHFFFGVGTVYVWENKNTVTYVVQSLRDITNVIIPHFDKYPLITQKRADYLLFKQGVNLLNLKAHSKVEGLMEILSLKASMNKEGLSDMLNINFPGIRPATRPLVNFEGIANPYWFTGFVDGEGSFSVDTSKAKTEGSFYTQISFSVSQHVRDEILLTQFINYLGCGRIVKASKRPDAVLFIVRKFSDIKEKVIPFFHNYPLLGVKFMDYRDFCEVAKIIENKSHLTPEGLKKIRSLKSGMNSNRICS
jgi:hypothetical protein